MYPRKISAILLICLACLAASGLTALAADEYIYTGGDGGNWDVPGNWTSGHIPNGAADQAWINSDPLTNRTVNLNMDATVSGLKVDSGDGLNINDSKTLSLAQDGATDPTVANVGAIKLDSATGYTSLNLSNGANVLFTGGGAVELAGDYSQLHYSGAGTFTNDTGHTIRGKGEIHTSSAMTNRGAITAQGGLLSVNGAINNHGAITAQGGDLLVNGVIDNTGKLCADNGALILAGWVENQPGSEVKVLGAGVLDIRNTMRNGLLELGTGSARLNGAKLTNLTAVGGSLATTGDSSFIGSLTLSGNNNMTIGAGVTFSAFKDGATNPTLSHGGTITLNSTSTSSYTYIRAGLGANLTFTGGGAVELAGPYSSLSYLRSGTFTNDTGHTIRGKGDIDASSAITNLGTITAQGGALIINCAVNNGSGSLNASDANSILELKRAVTGGALNPGSGEIRLSGGDLNDTTTSAGALRVATTSNFTGLNTFTGTQITVDNGQKLYVNQDRGVSTITHDGLLKLNSSTKTTSLIAADGANVLFTGGGTVELAGGYSQLHYSGAGTFTNDAGHTLRGMGTISATSAITNRGTIIAEKGVLTINPQVVGAGDVAILDDGTLFGTLDLRNHLQAGNLTMSQLAKLMVGNNLTVELDKNLSFAQTDPSRWSWGAATTLKMSGGGGYQYLEIGGQDQGAVAAGFSNNFNLVKLSLEGAGTYSYLWDAYDNEGLPAHDALYVNTLEVLPGTTLHLNQLHLYTYYGGVPYLVQAGDGGKFGGGNIIDVVVPLPGAVWLLGSGLLGLAAWRRRKN